MFCFPRRRFNIKFHVFLLRAFLCLRVVVFARLYKTPRYRKKVRAKTISSKIFLVGFFFFFFLAGVGGGGVFEGQVSVLLNARHFGKLRQNSHLF